MRNILTIAVLCLSVCAFTSCYKSHDCVCEIRTYALDVQDTVSRTTTHHTIRGTKDDAEAACKYYETEENYLGRPSYVYHYCEIVEDYDK